MDAAAPPWQVVAKGCWHELLGYLCNGSLTLPADVRCVGVSMYEHVSVHVSCLCKPTLLLQSTADPSPLTSHKQNLLETATTIHSWLQLPADNQGMLALCLSIYMSVHT